MADELETLPIKNDLTSQAVVPTPAANPKYPLRDDFRYFQLPKWTPPNPDQKEKEIPGFFESVGHEFLEWSMIGENVRSYQKRQALAVDNAAFKNPMDEDLDDNFDPLENRDLYLQTSPQYWDSIFTATSKQDQTNRYNYALKKMEDDEYFNNRSFMQNITTKTVGIAAAFVGDPYSWAPFSVGLKYAKLSTTIYKAIAKAAPTIAATSAVAESINYGFDPDMEVEDLGLNVLRDTVMGTLFVGAGAGLGRGMSGFKAYKSKNLMNNTVDGVGAKWNMSGDDQLLSLKAVPIGDTSVSAAKVQQAQSILDAGMKENGLFYVPFLGGAIKKGSSLISPVMRGITSPWQAVREFTNRMKDHDIATVDGHAVVPNAENFEQYVNTMQANLLQNYLQVEALRKQYNGVDLTVDEVGALQKFNSRLNKQDPADAASFGRRVGSAMVSDLKNQGLEIDTTTALMKKFFDDIYIDYQKSIGARQITPEVITANGYFPQVAHKQEIASRMNEAFDVIKSNLKLQETMIDELIQPMNKITEQIASTKELINKGIDLVNNRRNLAQLRKEKKAAIEDQHQKLWDNSQYKVLLQDRVPLSPTDRKKLIKLFAPVTKNKNARTRAANRLKKAQSDLSLLHFEIEKPTKKGMDENLIKRQHEEMRKRITEKEDEIKALKEERDTFEKAYLDEETKLRDRAENGEFPEHYYYRDEQTGFIHFADYKNAPKLRPKFESEADMDIKTQSIIDDYLNLSPEDLISNQMGNFDISANSLKKRSVMIHSNVMMDNGFLNTSLPMVMQTYSYSIGRKSAVNKSLGGMYHGKRGMDAAFAKLSDERNERINATRSLKGNEKAKALKKIQHEYDQAKEYMQNLHDALMGKVDGNQTVRFWTGALKSISAATRLTFTPLTQIADIGGIIFKHGMWRYLKDGLAPMVKTFHGMATGPHAEHYRKIIKEAGVAAQHIRMQGFNDSYYNDNYSSHYKRTAIEWLDKLAHKSANYSLMNRLDNLQQSATAQIAQSRLIESAHRFLKGELSKKEIEYLQRRGINMDEWAQRFVDMQKAHGEKDEPNLSFFYNWSDEAAKVKFGGGIRNIVRDTVLQTGGADVPFTLKNPTISMLFQFMGYSFNAFSRYTIPLMQRGEADQFVGVFTMAALSAFEGVTRKLARGEDVDWEDENFMLEAFSNSAPFSLLYKATMMANGFAGIFDSLKNDKYRDMSILGTSGGPGVGVINDFARLPYMAISGNYNQKDWNKVTKLIPFLNMWYTSAITQKGLDSLYKYYDVPKNRKESTSYIQKITE